MHQRFVALPLNFVFTQANIPNSSHFSKLAFFSFTTANLPKPNMAPNFSKIAAQQFEDVNLSDADSDASYEKDDYPEAMIPKKAMNGKDKETDTRRDELIDVSFDDAFTGPSEGQGPDPKQMDDMKISMFPLVAAGIST